MNTGTSHLPAQTSKIIRDLAQHIWDTTRDGLDTIWIGRGYQADGSEHETGRALDIIASSRVGIRPTATELAAGNWVVSWLILHADQLHVRHIIWQDKIYKHRYKSWQQFTGDRSSLTSRHEDHIHVLLQDTAGTVPAEPITKGITMSISRADHQLIAESAIQAQLVQTGRAPKAGEIANEFLYRKLGHTGPTTAVCLQSGFHNTVAILAEVQALRAELAALRESISDGASA